MLHTDFLSSTITSSASHWLFINNYLQCFTLTFHSQQLFMVLHTDFSVSNYLLCFTLTFHSQNLLTVLHKWLFRVNNYSQCFTLAFHRYLKVTVLCTDFLFFSFFSQHLQYATLISCTNNYLHCFTLTSHTQQLITVPHTVFSLPTVTYGAWHWHLKSTVTVQLKFHSKSTTVSIVG